MYSDRHTCTSGCSSCAALCCLTLSSLLRKRRMETRTTSGEDLRFWIPCLLFPNPPHQIPRNCIIPSRGVASYQILKQPYLFRAATCKKGMDVLYGLILLCYDHLHTLIIFYFFKGTALTCSWISSPSSENLWSSSQWTIRYRMLSCLCETKYYHI